jgi:cyclic beta-1,2-glucan synthetase
VSGRASRFGYPCLKQGRDQSDGQGFGSARPSMRAEGEPAVGLAERSDEPIRAELLSVERLAERGRELAGSQRVATTRRPRSTPLRSLLNTAGTQLAAFNATMTAGARAGRPVSPAMEWLLDNYYMIDEQVRTAGPDLPTGHGAILPRLTEGPLAGFPRVYEVAVTLLAHTDSRIEADYLERFVMAYQEVSPLSMGETWAVPAVLRIALVENLRRLASRVNASYVAETAAEDWADRLLLAIQDRPGDVDGLLAEMSRLKNACSASFLTRLAQRMSDQEADVSPVTSWLERSLREQGVPLDELAQSEQQRQGSDQVSIANAITSIRFVDASDWRAFFERCNLVEAALREDPAGVYASMDFASRDRYRHAVEWLAKRCPAGEDEVAAKVVARASEALHADAADALRGHVGFYLISYGRYEFERLLQYRPRGREHAHRSWLSRRGTIYWGMYALFTLLLTLGLAGSAVASGAAPWAVAVLVALALVPLSELAVNVANRLSAAIWPPRRMPKLDPEAPLAEAHRTLVVVPSLLTSTGSVREAMDRLEVHHLANSDGNIHFALLADLKGASSEHMPGDAEILDAVQGGLAELNIRYGQGGAGPFHAFVRSRILNTTEKTWMGWERKRGALTELTRLLRGAGETSITLQQGDSSFLAGVTFIITLDADTILPRDTARQMVCTIAHPLNRAQVDFERRIVARGYGLLQPRVGMSLVSASATTYAGLNTGPTGVDPYAGAVSDTYQDVFGEGSFTGKGIFEVDLFASLLEGRFPDNRLLSHDLIEGCFLRTGLASDIEVLDDFPGSYMTQCSRLHRWVRGDWQIAAWVGPTAPGPGGTRYRNPLSPLHKWKILDNLRRSIFPASMIAIGAAGWLLIPHPGWAWPATLAFILLFQALMHAIDSMVRFPRGIGLRAAVRPVVSELWTDITRAFVTLSFLPHQAVLQGDAAVRATWRTLVSKRHMLEWTTAAEAERLSGSSLSSFTRAMWPSVLLTLAAVTPALLLVPESRLWVTPSALAWIASPFVAWQLSKPRSTRADEPTAEEVALLRRIARRTWRFFETFVSEEDRFLAPDNYQEDPKGEIAHRTSPTNMGLQLISNLTAWDLGYVSTSGLIERVGKTLETMAGLERFRGHFYNWYDTRTLDPLRPAYVSTVDSGNLAGHLLVLRAGLLEVAGAPLVGPQALAGIADALRLALEDLLDDRTPGVSVAADSLRRDTDALLRRVTLAETPRNAAGWESLLAELWRAAELLAERAGTPDPELSGGQGVRSLGDAIEAIRRHRDQLTDSMPWAHLLSETPHAVAGWTRAYDLDPLLGHVPSLEGLAEGLDTALAALDALDAEPVGADDEDRTAVRRWARGVKEGILAGRPASAELIARLRLKIAIATDMWTHMGFAMLYDEGRDLFSIGFNTEQGQLDASFYDMLASECRLTSYLAVARGEVPQEHWFRLGRQLTRTAGGHALLSWSASMFEYLMPLLVMRTYPDTLLQRTYEAVVRRQQQYGAERGVPWGVSESAFAAQDVELTYQYQAFGVPGLGLKRGLSDDAVVAPYATMLALMVDRRAAVSNLRRLTEEGAEGPFGYYEALDYTPGRVPAGQRRAVVRTYMAHHQGMGLVAIGNELTGGRMRERFHSDPLVETAELLLQERVPRIIKLAQPHVEEVDFVRSLRDLPPPVARSYPLAGTPTPATHFLSNGRYSVMVTNAGGGYSRWLDFAVSRYREDITRDAWGQGCFIKDTASGEVWSTTHQPSLTPCDDYHCILSADRAEYRRRDGDLEAYTEVVVSPEDDVEVRRTALTNYGTAARTLDFTSYFEVALTLQGADQAHRAYSNLFIETESLPELRTLLFTRRPRSAHEPRVWGFHTVACDSPEDCAFECETDRARFLGRLRQVHRAEAVRGGGALSGTVGAVLDPVCSIRRRVTVGPGETVRLAFVTGVAHERLDALNLAEKYRDVRGAQRAIDLAWSTSQIELHDLGITPDEAVVFQRLASRLLLTDPFSRIKVKTPVENTLQMSALWGLGISGDHPILLLKIERLEDAHLVRQALLAHQYWRHKGFRCDLVVLNTKPSGYHSELDDRLHLLVRTGHALQMVDKPGGVFIRRADQIAPDVLNLLESVARATLEADRGPLLLQLNQRGTRPEAPDALVPRREPHVVAAPPFERPVLDFDNGYGGFDPATGEYVIVLQDGATTPAPWVNVMAGPEFGTMVSEAGVGCTWARNSHENRLTTWNNDPVSDGSGEIIYVRDEDSGAFWSPTQLPVPDDAPYVIRHGRGYTVFEHACNGIGHELTWFVPVSDPVRVARLRLTNHGDEARRLSVTQFVEWVLGDSRSKANQRVVTRYDTEAGMLTAHSWFNEDFPGRVAFLACDRRPCAHTASRTEFLGRNGTPYDPAAMHSRTLGELTGRFHDNCGALMAGITVEPGETAEVRFLLGQCDTIAEARDLVRAHREPDATDRALEAVREHWDGILSTLRVTTPDPALDAMVNGAAMYQALACRIWGRAAMYQSSGAFGFRDQLQDVLALTLACPNVAREHIIEASRHQFEAGDVLHWWQPVSGRGVRTRFTDDRNWLPFVVADYVEATGDMSVLDERTSYISGAEVPPEHEDAYLVPWITGQDASVYEHCVAALEASKATGSHGLPLMGGGDWNDGMNRVGIDGRGESVWLAWFLVLTLRRFAPLCELKGEPQRAEEYRELAVRLAAAVEHEAWDGSWYRRAYFDDGTPLGTRSADECRIDAIAQAWSVISGAADPARATRALEAVEEKLVRWEDGLVALLTPPFDRMAQDPGYIKGYVPGVRENGGQYTHAAVWVAMAYALMGEGDEAVALLDLINPLNHTKTAEDVAVYRVEPYVVAADVYAVHPHVGRGGWTWYTGAASWYYNVSVRNVLGIRTEACDGVRCLVIDPCVPKSWKSFSATLRCGASVYEITVGNPRGVNRGVERITLDGAVTADGRVPFVDDGRPHAVQVSLLGG